MSPSLGNDFNVLHKGGTMIDDKHYLKVIDRCKHTDPFCYIKGGQEPLQMKLLLSPPGLNSSRAPENVLVYTICRSPSCLGYDRLPITPPVVYFNDQSQMNAFAN